MDTENDLTRINDAVGDSIVAIAGDWHSNTGWIQVAIPFLRRAGVRTIYHVGDLGFWGEPEGTMLRGSLEYWLAAADINLFCTPGNHENWAALDELFAEGPGQPIRLELHLWMLPRGYRWTHAGRSFVALGGAPSVDVHYRSPMKTWWPTEIITEADVDRVGAGGPAEIMITHDAPTKGTEAVRRIREDAAFPYGDEIREYARIGERRLDRAFASVRPDLLFHGHFHVQDSVTLPSGQRVVSLDCENSAGNLALLDLKTLSVTLLGNPRKR
ncbi:metallophosphoesterase [Cryobacterium sp. CG_9.6]|uniref:metallophosphoesterase family protein n=1 Tax=Cryobacterium sp. CG_9.6 TaxID=2760710 RepID=UPI0024754A11|nr:metallophosphoesterase [Cryobacterium sp. CG_9.6]MDH6236292.1 hypothetical protein [Cryobacterium sp. CG_9.6]